MFGGWRFRITKAGRWITAKIDFDQVFMIKLRVPFFRPSLHEAEVSEVVATLRSGWLTSGPRVRRFEEESAAAVAV
jgi:hypothetical protein